MAGLNAGDEVRVLQFPTDKHVLKCSIFAQKLVFESSEKIAAIQTFDDLGLKEDLLRGIYSYSA